jgi:predicted DCC family thiol-disulfide oxidoreductase YuxK
MARTLAGATYARVVPTLVFDGDCGFCSTTARWYERHARTDVDVVAWQHLDLDAAGLTEAEVTTAAYWLDDGQKRRGARAVARALRECGPAYAAAGRLIDARPVRPAAAVGYALVSRFRHRLPGGTPACRL